VTSLYEHAGGDEALHRVEEIVYSKVLADPVLQSRQPEVKNGRCRASAISEVIQPSKLWCVTGELTRRRRVQSLKLSQYREMTTRPICV